MYIPGCITPCYTYCTIDRCLHYILSSIEYNSASFLFIISFDIISFDIISFDIASSLFQAYYITFDITSSYYHINTLLKGLGT